MTATRVATQLRVSEIFGPTIQGEGAVIGLPTIFVRLFGCDYRCSWCDSLHAVLVEHRGESTLMSITGILDRITELAEHYPILVTLSGGNPALHPLTDLIAEGHQRGLTFALETQGSLTRPWFRDLDYLTLSPKPPSSGETYDRETVDECIRAASRWRPGALGPRISLKVVVFDDADFDFALEVFGRWPGVPAFVQVGNPDLAPDMDLAAQQGSLMRRFVWLADKVVTVRAFEIRVLPQLHTLAWGNARAR